MYTNILFIFLVSVTFRIFASDLFTVVKSSNDSTLYLNFNETELTRRNITPGGETNYVFENIYKENELDAVMDNFKPKTCHVEEWNKIRTDTIPYEDLHRHWVKYRNIQTYLFNESPSLLAAFVHTDKIIVTMTSENFYRKPVYCRYYDCNKEEIPDQFKSFVYPESTVFCPRRPGAKYISITKTLNEKAEYSVPIVPRIGGLKHYFTVCVAPLYGDEPKFLQLAEFIEYYKLQGATFFNVYVRNISDYDRVLLDDYVRTGEVEVIKLHDRYWRDDWMWHNSEINDCHHRNKYFSKWTAVLDLDEHIEMKTNKFKRIVDLLDNVKDPNIINLHFRVQWVIKDQDSPARYVSDQQIIEDLEFRKYRNSSQIADMYVQPKCIIRPERIAFMTVHYPITHYYGLRMTVVNPDIGVVRHYRNVKNRVFNDGYSNMMKVAPFNLADVPEWIKQRLTKNVLDRVKWVYDISDVSCEKKMYIYKLYDTNYSCVDE